MNYVILEITITILGCLIFCYFLWDKVNFDKIEVIGISLGVIAVSSIFNLFRNFKLIATGQDYTFNKSLNSISKNGRRIATLDSLYKIHITEHLDSESSTQYELLTYLKNETPISFEKSTNLKFQKILGDSISKLTGIPFTYQTKEEVNEIESLKQQEIDRQPYIKIFEEKFKEKSKSELIEISKEDSSYAEYAKEAARNLLRIMNNTNEKTNVQPFV